MKQIRIGTRLEGEREIPVLLDAQSLIYSRALIQANSGGGKTGLLRVIAEQVAATIPTIIIDKEGEYYTLREKVDLVLVGEQGELAADVRSAGLLARKLIELGASAVIDLSSLKAGPQQDWVKAFLDSLMELPRKLWHPTLIAIDEAHLFAPEKGMGESEATLAVIDLMTRGRKRGFGGLLATTRLSKLHKNAADANNIFIGRTVLDVDQTRAAKNLGMKPGDALTLRDIEKQNFFAYGPDVDFKGVELFHVANAETSFPKPGDRHSLTPPKASHVVIQIADKLKDIQQEAEAEIRTLNEAKAEIAKLRRELRQAKSGAVPREQDTKRIAELEAKLEAAKGATRTETKVVEKRIMAVQAINRLQSIVDKFEVGAKVVGDIRAAIAEGKELNAQEFQKVASVAPVTPRPVPARPIAPQPIRATVAHSNGNGALDKFELTLLRKLADRSPVPTTRSQLFALSGFSIKSSNYPKKANRLVEAGVAEDGSGGLVISDAGRDYLGGDYVPAPSSGDAALQYWIQKLPAYESGMLAAIARAGELGSEDIARETNRSLTSSAFPKAIKNLLSLSFIAGQDPYRLGEVFQ